MFHSCFFFLHLLGFIIGAKKLIGASVPLTRFVFHLCCCVSRCFCTTLYCAANRRRKKNHSTNFMKINFCSLIMSFDDIKNRMNKFLFSSRFGFCKTTVDSILNRNDEEIRPLAICLTIGLPLVLSGIKSGVRVYVFSLDYYIIPIHSILIHFFNVIRSFLKWTVRSSAVRFISYSFVAHF